MDEEAGADDELVPVPPVVLAVVEAAVVEAAFPGLNSRSAFI